MQLRKSKKSFQIKLLPPVIKFIVFCRKAVDLEEKLQGCCIFSIKEPRSLCTFTLLKTFTKPYMKFVWSKSNKWSLFLSWASLILCLRDIRETLTIVFRLIFHEASLYACPLFTVLILTLLRRYLSDEEKKLKFQYHVKVGKLKNLICFWNVLGD